MAGADTEHQLSLEKSGDTFSIVPNEDHDIVAAESSQPAGSVDEPRREMSRPSASKTDVPTEKKVVANSAKETGTKQLINQWKLLTRKLKVFLLHLKQNQAG
jgi:hypothetical protein